MAYTVHVKREEEEFRIPQSLSMPIHSLVFSVTTMSAYRFRLLAIFSLRSGLLQ